MGYLSIGGITINNGGGITTLAADPLPGDFADPSTPVTWVNSTEGVMKYWNGTEIKIIDTNEGPQLSTFGTPLGDI